MAKVTVDLAGTPKGVELEIPGLGLFKNGESREVDDRSWRRFQRNNPEYTNLSDIRITSAEARKASEAHQNAQQADLGDLKKDELVDVAKTVGVDDPNKFKKDELVTKVEEARG